MQKPIIDVCCGGKMFWFDKDNPNVMFCDNRELDKINLVDNRVFEVKPDMICDFTDLPFPDKSFKLVVMDPPHLKKAGPRSYMAIKYGKLDDNWEITLNKGFKEAMRILDDYGVLIFKWSEIQIPIAALIKALGTQPLFGHRTGRYNKTHWLCFMKIE